MRTLNSVADVVDVLGGRAAVARMTDRTTQAVTNWKAAQRFPSWTFLLLRQELASRGYAAPASLWSISDPGLVKAAS